MERNQTGSLTDYIEQSAEITEPRQNLGVLLDELEIQIGKELHATVSPTLGKDDFYLFIQKGGVELGDFSAGGRQFGHWSLIEDFEIQLLQILYTGLEVSLFFDLGTWCNCVYGFQPNLL